MQARSNVKIIPCLQDNYAFLVEAKSSSQLPISILIDAPEFQNIDDFLNKKNSTLSYILSTHHHWDHIGGNLELKKKYACTIIGSEDDKARIPGIDHPLKDGEVFLLGDQTIEAIFVPGHTSHHVIYYFKNSGLLFSGDTLFSMGCGRLFEGTYNEMFNSLQKIKSLPPETSIFCGHEYTIKNGQFALTVEPSNSDIKLRLETAHAKVNAGLPTIPSTLEMELKTNPFLRASTVDEFARLRQLRDNF